MKGFAMIAPEPPALRRMEHISPASYEASLACMAKAAWYAFGDRSVLPDHPATLLGICFHAVAAAAHRGGLTGEGEALLTSARELFDHQAQRLHFAAHPLLKQKFPSVERIPYYYMQRERAVVRAEEIAVARSSGRTHRAQAAPQRQTESRLASQDGLIVGRPDHLDGPAETVVDYKTGGAAEARRGAVSAAEARQLRLYAYLGGENGTSILNGEVVRGDGDRCTLPISPGEAASEADIARAQLRIFNDKVQQGRTFEEMASPSAAGCAMCPCIPFCEAFWKNASPEWSEQCGVQVEGQVNGAAEAEAGPFKLVTLGLNFRRGTIRAGDAAIEQIPQPWLAVGGGPLPVVGDIVRVVHGRIAGDGTEPIVVRVDKTLTSVWVIAPPKQKGPADG
jgi:hypothetical protein